MEVSLLQYYSNGDISLMKEFLLTIPIFNQIYYYLGTDKFYQFLQCIEVHSISFSVSFELSPLSAYLFLGTGVLVPKAQKKQNLQRLSKLSNTKYIEMITIKQPMKRESQKIRPATINKLYNEGYFFHQNYMGQSHYFISNQQKASAIIELNFQKLQQSILKEVRWKHNQKLKLIGNSPLFINVQKSFIQSSLSDFSILKVSFDQFLMKKPNLRNHCMFFLTSGEVQISTDERQNKKTYLIKAPAIIGYQPLLSIKSITQSCLSFYVQKNQIINIYKKNLDQKYWNPQIQDNFKQLLRSICKDNIQIFNRQIQFTNTYSKSLQFFHKVNNTNNKFFNALQNSNKNIFRIKQQKFIKFSNEKVSQSKKVRILQHFANHINDKFSKFVIRKTQFLKKKSDNNDSVLYEIKTLQPKQPQMSLINEKLKVQRMNRLQRCKQNIIVTKDQNLSLVNIRDYEQFENSKLINKIRTKIDKNINKKKYKSKHWKSYVPTNVAFNRLSDLLCAN